MPRRRLRGADTIKKIYVFLSVSFINKLKNEYMNKVVRRMVVFDFKHMKHMNIEHQQNNTFERE